MSEASLICVMIILIIAFTIILFLQKKPVIISKALGFVALIALCLLFFLILKAEGLGRFMVKTTGEPIYSIQAFYDNLIAGNYDSCYAALYDTKTLGFEEALTDNLSGSVSDNDMLLEALKKSYSYEIVKEPVINELTAVGTVAFTYLNIDRFEGNISARIDNIIKEKVRTMKKADLYNESGDYKEGLLEEVYKEAMVESLKWADEYYETITYDVELIYENNQWYLKYNDEITKGLTGGQ